MATVTINNFNLGGIAESKYSGVPYSLAKMVGVDVHNKPGAIQANYKLSKESGTTIDAPVQVIVPCSDGNSYLFSKTTGKVWKRTSAGSYSLVHTTTPASGNAGCLGAAEYNGYIWWATSEKLHRIAIADLSNWAANADEDWATFTNGDTSYHPMTVVNLVLYIGDGNLVAQVDNVTFTANALDVQDPKRIASLGKALTDLAVGTFVNDNVNKSSVYDWDTWSVSFKSEDEIDEVGVNAFLKADNYVIVNAGLNGNLYSYNLQELTKLKKIPGTYTTSATGIVYPNAVANLYGMPLFGFSQVTGNPTEFGVYSLGAANPAFSNILNLEYPVYPSTSIVTSDLIIHSMATVGNVLLVAWEYDSTYGVSNLDYTTRANGAYFDTKVIRGDRDTIKTVKSISVGYSELPTGTSISAKIKNNYEDTWQDVTLVKDTIRKRYFADLGHTMNTYELRVIFNTNEDDTPVIDEVSLEVE